MAEQKPRVEARPYSSDHKQWVARVYTRTLTPDEGLVLVKEQYPRFIWKFDKFDDLIGSLVYYNRDPKDVQWEYEKKQKALKMAEKEAKKHKNEAEEGKRKLKPVGQSLKVLIANKVDAKTAAKVNKIWNESTSKAEFVKAAKEAGITKPVYRFWILSMDDLPKHKAKNRAWSSKTIILGKPFHVHGSISVRVGADDKFSCESSPYNKGDPDIGTMDQLNIVPGNDVRTTAGFDVNGVYVLIEPANPKAGMWCMVERYFIGFEGDDMPEEDSSDWHYKLVCGISAP